MNGSINLTNNLLQHCTNINVQNNDGNTPLHLLIMYLYDIKNIIKNQPYCFGQCKCLNETCDYRYLCVEKIIECVCNFKNADADIHLQNKNKQTSFQLLCTNISCK